MTTLKNQQTNSARKTDSGDIIALGVLLLAGWGLCNLLARPRSSDNRRSPAELTEREIIEEIIREERL